MFSCVHVSIRRPHNPASIHHSPPPSHPCRPHRSFRHPHLRPCARWQHRYSTARHISTGPFAPSSTFPSALLQLSSQNISFYPINAHFTFAILISCQGSKIAWVIVFKRGFCCPNTQSTAPLGISETSVLLCLQTSKKQMSGPAENVWPQETSHHHSKRCVRAQIILTLKALFQRVNFGVWCAQKIHFRGVRTL